MFAYKETEEVAKKSYHCDRCGEDLDCEDEPFQTLTVYYHEDVYDDHNGSDDAHCHYLYTSEPGIEESAWQCYNEHLHHDEGSQPAIKETAEVVVWVCGNCETRYEVDDYSSPEEAEKEAVACCKDD
jgi:transcription elongation factor Elf1